MKNVMMIFSALLMCSAASAELLSVNTTTLVGVDEKGNQLLELTFLAGGKVKIQREGKSAEIVEAIRNTTQDCTGWDLGKKMQLTMCDGVSGAGSYRDRVNHFYADFDENHVELRPNAVLSVSK